MCRLNCVSMLEGVSLGNRGRLRARAFKGEIALERVSVEGCDF